MTVPGVEARPTNRGVVRVPTPRLYVAGSRPDDNEGDILATFGTWLRSWGAADETVRVRLSVLKQGLAVWGDYAAVTTVDLSDWLANPRLAAQWTRVTYYQHVKSFFGWLYDTDRIPVDPTVKLRTPRAPKDLPRPLTPDEAERALAAATGRIRTWLLLGLLAGLRAHEIAKIRGQDVDEGSIFVVGKGGKKAFIPTHPDLWTVAQTYPARGYWFPPTRASKLPHIPSTYVTELVTAHFRSLGIEGSIHRTRHSFATQLLRSGANLRVTQTLMRHESLASTAKYTAVGEEERMIAVRNLGVKS
ncbi:MAG: integrase/recombinase XerD [Nocardioidaceae bacterium]|jgi:integrase|nr:integrase/recombinase XerD [Nocardioidaceae bacterium]